MDAHLEYDSVVGNSTITMEGPSEKWFGFGFGPSAMMQNSLAFIAEGDGSFQMRLLGYHSPGTLIPPGASYAPGHYKILSNDVTDGRRKVVFTYKARLGSNQGLEHVSHPVLGSTINLDYIQAVGMGPMLSYHGSTRASGTLNLFPGGVDECICKSDPKHAVGTIAGVTFVPHCAPQLIAEGNPTCSVETYTGGLHCCVDGTTLLNADQMSSRSDITDTVYVKVRVYYTPSDKQTDQSVPTDIAYYAPEGDQIEYNIPQMESGVHVLTVTNYVATAFGIDADDEVQLIAAQGHCHTPQCIKQELYDARTGELLCSTDMKYGGTDLNSGNEEGYIVGSSMCVWGKAENGLRTPLSFKGTDQIITKKYANATYAHYGDMA